CGARRSGQNSAATSNRRTSPTGCDGRDSPTSPTFGSTPPSPGTSTPLGATPTRKHGMWQRHSDASASARTPVEPWPVRTANRKQRWYEARMLFAPRQSEIRFEHAGGRLVGDLFVPQDAAAHAPVPAAVMVHGSGPAAGAYARNWEDIGTRLTAA